MSRLRVILILLLGLACCGRSFATRLAGRYALILQDEPAAKTIRGGADRTSLQVLGVRQTIRAKQAALRDLLKARGFQVTASADTILNAVFVIGTPTDVPVLRSLPGVKRVVFLPAKKLDLDAAAPLVNAPNAWAALGGAGNAGANIKIAILDTGIDQTHPAFRDASLQTPTGFPKSGSDDNFTNSKVIVARSYVKILAGIDPGPIDPTNTRPDDYSARDRVGHGTAVAMSAAGNTNTGPIATITGMAPHAYLGNYKIFGSPELNDFSTGDAIITALEDAFNDGMDIAVLSLGGPALSGPLDTAAQCGGPAGDTSPCDPEVAAIENVVANGMVVVAAAGNEGNDGVNLPVTYNTISSPGYAPGAIAVGATTNAHFFSQAVHINGPNVPNNLKSIEAAEGDGPALDTLFTAPLKDASTIGDPLGCAAYPAGSLQGTIALISRGTCTFFNKVLNAQTANAAGVIIVDTPGSSSIVLPGGLDGTQVPTFAISYTDGQAVKNYLSSATGVTAGLDPNLTEVPDPSVNQIAYFSSRGPVTGTGGLKPDVVAPGTNIYMAAENYDPNGALYSPNRYIAADGTSFSTPIVAGLAALVKQAHDQKLTPNQIKSALVNTATSDISDPDTGQNPASVLDVGGGKADGLAAINTTISIEPSNLSFGVLPTGFTSSTQTLTIRNYSGSTATLNLVVSRTTADSATQFSLDQQSIQINAGDSKTVNVTLSGKRPTPGIYEGNLLITGGPVPLHAPFLYLVGDGVPANLIPLTGIGETGTVGQGIPDGYTIFKLVDQYGVGVAGQSVTWTTLGGGSLTSPDATTDRYGIAGAQPVLPNTPGGPFTYRAAIPGFSHYDFQENARLVPTINAGGAVNAASNLAGNGIAPGSIISLYGTGLADPTVQNNAGWTPLPIALDSVSVSFDVPSAAISVPGSLYYVSPLQVNVQVPWEIANQSNVALKVNVDFSSGLVYNAPVTTYSPACYTLADSAAGQIVIGLDVSSNQIIGSSHPATRGQYVALFCNGFGPVSNQPATGAVALSDPLSKTPSDPVVTIGGQPATVQFSGLAPGFVGLYQINLQVPSNISAGVQPIAMNIGGASAPVVNIPVQ